VEGWYTIESRQVADFVITVSQIWRLKASIIRADSGLALDRGSGDAARKADWPQKRPWARTAEAYEGTRERGRWPADSEMAFIGTSLHDCGS
jgi:hypothetical protein